LLFILLFGKIGSAQSYEITIKIDGLKSKMAALGYFVGNQQFQTDTARVDTATGTVVFRGNRKLLEGMYFVGSDSLKLLDFMVDADQNFKISGKIFMPDSMFVEGSEENLVFFEHKKAISPLFKQLKSANEMYEFISRATKNQETLNEFRSTTNNIYQKLSVETAAIVQKYPNFLYTKMLKTGFNPIVPKELAQKIDGKINKQYVDYLKVHYFDNFDFGDTRLLYCNVFPERITGFFRGFYPETPDSLAAACDFILQKTEKGTPEFHKWTMIYLTELFEKSPWPAAANVFVHLVDRWQQPKQQPWIDEATQLRLQYKADVWRPTQFGLNAPPLILADTLGKMTDLKSVDAPVTMLVFYSPLCEHCKEIMPKLWQIHQYYAEKGLKTVAVSTEVPVDYWRDFIKKEGWNWLNLIDTENESALQKTYATFNLPVIYLLDKDKKIIGRRLRLDELKTAFEQLF
jgi:thiol-disulfide isomerase/thioredoxin